MKQSFEMQPMASVAEQEKNTEQLEKNVESFEKFEAHAGKAVAEAAEIKLLSEELEQGIQGENLTLNEEATLNASFAKIKDRARKLGRFIVMSLMPAIMAGAPTDASAKVISSTEKKNTIEHSVTKHDVVSHARRGIAPIVYSEGHLNAEAVTLKKIADQELKKKENLHNCNKYTSSVATLFGHNELEGKMANEQVEYMKKHWKHVDAKTAQEIANRGGLVIAGLADQEKTHGHTIVVVPGAGEVKPDNLFYPNVEGGGMNMHGRSDGHGTAGDVFTVKTRAHVLYFTPQQG